MKRTSHDWVESTRNIRFLAYGFIVLMGAASLALQGEWGLAAASALLGAAIFGALWLFLQFVRRTPSIEAADIEKSVKRVGARKDP